MLTAALLQEIAIEIAASGMCGAPEYPIPTWFVQRRRSVPDYVDNACWIFFTELRRQGRMIVTQEECGVEAEIEAERASVELSLAKRYRDVEVSCNCVGADGHIGECALELGYVAPTQIMRHVGQGIPVVRLPYYSTVLTFIRPTFPTIEEILLKIYQEDFWS